MQFQSYYNRFLLSLEGTKNIYVSFCENIISFCAPRTFRFADYTSLSLNDKSIWLSLPFLDKNGVQFELNAIDFFFLPSRLGKH